MSRFERNGFLSWRRLRNALGSTGTATGHLKYSDYFQGAALITGIIGGSQFIANGMQGTVITGYALLLTTILGALSQFLQSKGD